MKKLAENLPLYTVRFLSGTICLSLLLFLLTSFSSVKPEGFVMFLDMLMIFMLSWCIKVN